MKLVPARKRRLIVLLGLVLVSAGIVVFRSKPAFVPIRSSVQFLLADSQIPAQPDSLFERTVPMSWGWLWRLRDRVRGQRPTLLFDVKIIDCSEVSEQAISGLITEPSLAETNGLRGWILDGPALTALQQQFKQRGGREVMRARLTTSPEVQSSMSVGTPASGTSPQSGLVLDLLPLLQPDGMALMSVFTLTEAATNRTASISEAQGTATVASGAAIVTNLTAAARWQLPDGTGFFLLGPDAANEGRCIGVIVSVTVQRPKK